MKSPFSWQFQEDKLIDAHTIPIWDRGFRYGMSVFETILLHRGRAVLVAEHLERLQKASAAAGFVLPVGLRSALVRRIEELGGSFSGMLRIYVTAGSGAPLSETRESRVYVFGEEAEAPSALERERGWNLHVCRAPITAILGGWKTGNYWPHIQALMEARQSACDENVMLDLAGSVVSAAMANLFALIDGEWLTPPLACGARDGVVRDWVMQNSSAREEVIVLEALLRATECFLTNSRIGIQPVRSIDGRELPSQSAGRLIYDTYREKILGP